MGHYFSFFRASLRLWRRHFIGVFIAFAGLSAAFAVAILTAFYVYDGMRSDAWIPGVESLYRLKERSLMNGKPDRDWSWSALAHPALIPRLKPNFAEVEETLRILTWEGRATIGAKKLKVKLSFVDPSFENLIPLRVLAGDLGRTLADASSVALTRSEAWRLFGDHALGQTFEVKGRDGMLSYKVGAVVADIPANSHLSLTMLAGWHETPVRALIPYYDKYSAVQAYVRLKPGSFSPAFAARFDKVASALEPPGYMAGSSYEAGIEPVLGAQYFSKSHNYGKPTVDRQLVAILAIMAAVLMVVASLNSVSLFTALNLLRVKGMAIRRVFGAGRGALAGVFMAESVLVSLLAYGMGILLASDLAPAVAALARVPIPVLTSARLPLLLAGTAMPVLVGMIGAFYLTMKALRLRPQTVLHGAQASIVSARGRMRELLVAVQAFVVVGALIAAAQIVYHVHAYITRDLGFHADGLVFLEAPDEDRRALFIGSFLDQVRSLPEVDAAEVGGTTPFAAYGTLMSVSLRSDFKAESQPVLLSPVSPDYFKMLGMTMLAADPSDWHDRSNLVVLTKTQLGAFGFTTPEAAIGQLLTMDTSKPNRTGQPQTYRIAGVVKPVEDSGYKFSKPTLYAIQTVKPAEAKSVRDMMILTHAPAAAVDRALENAWHVAFPNDALKLDWVRDRLEVFQQKNVDTAEAIGLMAALCAILCLAGLYGMANHWATTRRRELALRRVLGATGRDVSLLFMKKMMIPVVLGAVAALVPAWALMHEWRTVNTDWEVLPWPLYGVAAAAVALLAALILIGHIRRVLAIRPATVLHHE